MSIEPSLSNKLFDYIIVGGGTAGCILANRLSADGKHQVLLLEAGEKNKHPWISIPAGFSKLLTHETFNWRFQSQPEENTLQRQIAIPRGKGLGGSTLINGMIYVRGIAEDFDGWAEQGATGWSFAQVAPYFKKLEHYLPPAGQYADPARGLDGPLYIVEESERHPLTSAFIKSAQRHGLPLNPDYNVGAQLGVGYYQVVKKNGRRWHVADAYIEPARGRKNLHIVTGFLAHRLLFENQKCIGVRGAAAGKTHVFRAGKEVIVSAGAIQSPQLLELSGIGSKERLQALGIEVVRDLPAVGENYIDHYCTRMNWRLQGITTLNEQTRGLALVKEVMKYAFLRRGALSLGTGLVYGFVKSDPDLPLADVQFFFVHASYANAAERILDKAPGMTIGVAQLRPQSVGSIHIAKNDIHAQPLIKPNFLSAQTDRESLIGGMKVARDIVGTAPLRQYVAQEISPGSAVVSDEEWLQFARENGQTIYHPIGTCRMGTDANTVVDPELRVRGVQGLRVVDASIMPAMVSGNTQAAVMMIAEKAADHILSR